MPLLSRTKLSAFWEMLRLFVRVRVQRRELVLIERPYAGIGDMICLLAAAAQLRAERPQAWVVFAAHPLVESLARRAGVVNQVVRLSTRPHRRASEWARPENQLVALLPDELTPPEPRRRISLADTFAHQLGLQAAGPLPVLQARHAERRRVRARLFQGGWDGKRSLLVVHTGPTWPVKEWPAGHWVELRQRLAHREFFWVQIGADEAGGRRAARVPDSLDLVNESSLEEVVALLAQAEFFVGIDSGPLHLAYSAGARTIGLFGPTDPECFLPATGRTVGLRAPLDCAGCHHDAAGPRHWRNGCPFGIRCMQELSPAEVAATLVEPLPRAA